jgi:ComEC/Rec2-related protein
VSQDFVSTGLTHLTAVSGANLTLLLAFLLTMARWAGVRGWWLRVVGLAGVIIFIALCRTEPSVLRAAAMGLVALAALGSGSRTAGVRNLAVATMILLLVDPFLSRSIGFALSVLACAGIVWWSRRWTMIINQWLPHIIAESIAVPLAAQLATTPLVAAISGRVSISGLAANALAGPFVGPATVLGFAAAGVSLLKRDSGCHLRLRRRLVRSDDHLDRQDWFLVAWLRMAPAGDAADPDLAGHQLGDFWSLHGLSAGATMAGPVACRYHDHLSVWDSASAGLASSRLGLGRLRRRSR